MSNPALVSVLMTAYNREKYIAEAIESVLASTYINFELIIVDDCSTDKTVEIARRFEKEDQRVKVYVNEKNLGDYPNRNKAASYAKGLYLMFVDSDDKILPKGIETCISAMGQFPECGFGINYKNFQVKTQCVTPNDAIQKHFFEKPFLMIGPGGTVLKRDFFFKIKQYPIKYGPANDMYFNLKAASAGCTVLLPFEFMFYRLHEGQQLNNSFSYLHNNYQYLRDALIEIDMPIAREKKRWLHKKNKRRFLVNITKFYFKTRQFRKAREAIRLAQYSFKDAMIGMFHLD